MSKHETLSIHDYSRNKICDLYDSSVELIGQAYDIEITKEFDGTKALSFRIPYIIHGNINNFRWEYMKSDYLIRYTCDNKNTWFIANKPKKSKSNKEIYGDVVCNGYETLLKTRNLYMVFDDENGIGTIGYLMTQILRGTGWTFDSAGSDTLRERDNVTEKVRSLKSDGKKGALDLIITTCNLFQARPIFDTDAMKVSIKAINNRTQVLEGEVGRNLTALTVSPESTDIVTRLYVEGEYGDYGYVGIDDVEVNGQPYGLPFIVNFDYYRELGTFTQAHETALSTYLSAIKAKKAAIRANGALMIDADDDINTMIGQCKLAVYYKNESLVTPKYTHGDITAEQAALNAGDEVYILLNNGKYTVAEWSGSSQLSSAYGVAKFATPSAGKIGSAEVLVTSKEKTIAQLQHKIDTTTSADKIAEYTAEITRLEGEISALYNDATNGLYVMMNSVMNATGLLYHRSQYYSANVTLNNEQDDIEATFIAAMGYMLRDGYWNNKNYTVGQEQYLYADALDMAEQMGKPKKTYTFSYVRVTEDFGIPAEDIDINAVFKIYDKELGIDDGMFIKKITYGVDKKSLGTIDVSNQDITLSSNDLGSLLSRISQLADLIDQKNALYDRAKAISAGNTIFADRLNGRIDVLKNQLLSTVSNWYTDEQGNIMFLSADGGSAMMLCGAGFMIANSKDENNEWVWRTFGTGEGFTADEIVAGFISAERIEAGSISVNKLESNAGSTLVISGNPSITSLNGQIAPAFDATQSYAKGQIVTKDGVMYVFTQNHSGTWNSSHVEQTKVSAQIELMPDRIEQTVATNFAPEFNTTTTYNIGDIVSYSGSVYRFTSQHPGGAWNSSHVTQVSTSDLYIAKTTAYQTAGAIVFAAQEYTDENAYAKVSGIVISPDGIDITGYKYLNMYAGSGIYIDSGATFEVYGGNFSIDQYGNATFNGGGTFSGELVAATGTFAGTLNASCINAGKINVDRINITELFSQQAAIDAINTTDISSNSYLQVMVNRKNRIYVQWETPTDAHNGDLWYKRAPQPIDEMQDNTMSELDEYPVWSFDGYELYQMQEGSWVQIDDTSEIRDTMSRLIMEDDRIDLAIYNIESEVDGKYTRMSGIEIVPQGVEVSGGTYVKIKTGGWFTVDSGNFSIDTSGDVAMTGSVTASSGQIGGFYIGATRLNAGSSSNYICIDSGTANFDYFIMAGGETAANAKFLLTKGGALTVESLTIRNEAGTATEQINLSNYALWKLNYSVVKSHTSDSITLSDGTTINFNTAAGVTLSGGWTDNWTKYTVTATDAQGNVVDTISSGAVAADMTNADIKAALESAASHSAVLNIEADGETLVVRTINASGVYDQGYAAGSPASGSASGRSGSSYSWAFSITKGDGSSASLSIDCSAIYADARSGYTQGIFSQYSGDQLYTMGQSGPQVYSGTLYVKS